jgi:predicted kinase
VIRKRLFGVALTHRLPASAYDAEVSERIYRSLREEAATALAAGCCVVADAIHARPAERDAIAAVARAARVPFVGLWLEAPADTLAARIDARRGDASDATSEVLQQQLGYDLGAMTWHRVDARGTPDSVLAAARQTVDRALADVPAA